MGVSDSACCEAWYTTSMSHSVRRLLAILGPNTVLALILAVGSMSVCVYFDWKLDFPLTIIGIAVVFPIVFSISGAYQRREAALVQYGIMKSAGRSIVLATRDWYQAPVATSDAETTAMKEHVASLFTGCVDLFRSETIHYFNEQEQALYRELSRLSQRLETLRARGFTPADMGRVHGYLYNFLTAFETLKHIYQYRTPRTLRLYSKFFIYATLIFLGPYFALLVAEHTVWLGYSLPILFAMILTGLDNIQEHLENPFDQIGEDDIKIHPEKFLQTIA